MTVLDKLASSLGRRDEEPNKQLAEEIAATDNKGAVKELIEHLHGKKKDIQSDCIKVVYEIGERKPALIAPYLKEFIGLLQHKEQPVAMGSHGCTGCDNYGKAEGDVQLPSSNPCCR
jgi:hypothetical protein